MKNSDLDVLIMLAEAKEPLPAAKREIEYPAPVELLIYAGANVHADNEEDSD